MKITIIMALYNVSAYIDKAIGSILSQTIGQDNLKVIMVDDRSTDDTYLKAQEYCRKNSNFSLFQTKKNSGSGGTPRNIALARIETPYFMILDPDDYYSKDACKTLYDKMIRYKVNLVRASCEINGKKDLASSEDVLYTSKDDILRLPIRNISAQLYETRIIREKNVRFTEGIIYEDNEFYYKYMLGIQNVLCTADIIHFYNTRDDGNELSATRKHTAKSLDDLCTAFNIVSNLFNEENRRYFEPIGKYNYLELLWKIAQTEELTREQEKNVAEKIGWTFELNYLDDEQMDIVRDLIRAGQINILRKYFRLINNISNKVDIHEKIVNSPEISIKKLLLLKIWNKFRKK